MKNKKQIITLSCLLLLVSIFVTGCKKEIEVKDGSKVAVSVEGGKITATEYYQKIKEKNVSTLVDMIDLELFEEKYPTTTEEDEQVKKQITQLKESYPDKDTLNSILNQYFGVNTEEELEELRRIDAEREAQGLQTKF